jgi:hypothetical protein
MPSSRSGVKARGVKPVFERAGLPPIPWEALGHLVPPSSQRYQQLVADLVLANQAVGAGDDELYIILKCLVSVLRFIDADLIVRDVALTRPFGVLARSLRDLGQGARPPLFFERPSMGPGRPKDTSFASARGAIAAAVAYLIDDGESRNDAAKFVVTELQRALVQAPGGKPIKANQVLRWRDVIGATASTLAEQSYRVMQAKYAGVPPELVATAAGRRGIVQGSMSAIWSMGF